MTNSNIPQQAGNNQLIYQLNPETAEVIKKCKENVHHACKQHLNRPVRVQTVHGQTHEGTIVHIDAYYLYLQIKTTPEPARAFGPGFYPYPYPGPYGGGFGYNPYSNVILPLALFDLLAVSLLF